MAGNRDIAPPTPAADRELKTQTPETINPEGIARVLGGPNCDGPAERDESKSGYARSTIYAFYLPLVQVQTCTQTNEPQSVEHVQPAIFVTASFQSPAVLLRLMKLHDSSGGFPAFRVAIALTPKSILDVPQFRAARSRRRQQAARLILRRVRREQVDAKRHKQNNSH